MEAHDRARTEYPDKQMEGEDEDKSSSASDDSSRTSSSALYDYDSSDLSDDSEERSVDSETRDGSRGPSCHASASSPRHRPAPSSVQRSARDVSPLAALSPARRKVGAAVQATLGSGNEKWEVRQAHRRLREIMSCFPGRSSVKQEIGTRQNFGVGPDRGRLIREANANRALELGVAGSRAAKLPPVAGGTTSVLPRRIVTVERDAVSGQPTAVDRAPGAAPSLHVATMLTQMGYRALQPAPAAKGSGEVEVDLQKEEERDLMKRRQKSRLRKLFLDRNKEKWAAEDAVPEVIAEVAEDARRRALAELFPHLDASEFPPRVDFSDHAQFRNPARCTEYPAAKRGRAREERLCELYDLVNPEDVDGPEAGNGGSDLQQLLLRGSGADSEAQLPDDAEARRVLENPIKLVKQLDDRPWGLSIGSSESVNRLRQRVSVQHNSNSPPRAVADSELCFGAIDRLLEISADSSFSLPSKGNADISSDLLVQQASLNISNPRQDDTCHLYVLCVGVAGTSPIGLPYSEAERNALWMADLFRAIGASVQVLLGCDATQNAIRSALSSLLQHARESVVAEPKVILYFSGRGRVDEHDELMFVPVDGLEMMSGPAVHLMSRVVNLHQLSQRHVLDRFQDGSSAGTRGTPAAGTASKERPFSQRWSYPVVVAELLVERADSPGKAPRELVTDAERMDFWRPEYIGTVLAPAQAGGNLWAQCSFRHHSFVSYYFAKCFDGRLTGVSQHVGSMPNIVQFIAAKIRKRNFPTLVLRCPPAPAGSVSRASEEIIRVGQTFFPTAAAKEALKASRLNRKCRFQIICEVDVRYRTNPTAFVTRLTARFREVLLHNKSKTKNPPPPAVPLSLWFGTRRMEHRMYLPLSEPLSMDQTRFDMLQVINLSAVTGTRMDELASARALETLENCRMETAKLEHCIVMYSAGQLQNRWGKIPASQVQEVDASMSFRPKEELENDFVTFIASAAYNKHRKQALEYLFEKVFTDLVAIQGTGSHSDVRRIAKMLRFGTLDTIGACSCRIERLEVTSFGAQEAETMAAVFVQRMVRRYLTGRLMRSRLAAAMTCVREHSDALARALAAYKDEIVNIFHEYQEATFTALEREAARSRYDLLAEETESFLTICRSCVTSWVALEGTRRKALELDYISEALTLSKISATLPAFYATVTRCSNISAVEHRIRGEALQRQRTVVEEYGERVQLRAALRAGCSEISARENPPVVQRVAPRARKKPKSLDVLSRMK